MHKRGTCQYYITAVDIQLPSNWLYCCCFITRDKIIFCGSDKCFGEGKSFVFFCLVLYLLYIKTFSLPFSFLLFFSHIYLHRFAPFIVNISECQNNMGTFRVSLKYIIPNICYHNYHTSRHRCFVNHIYVYSHLRFVIKRRQPCNV